MSTLKEKIPAGVVTGDQVQEIFAHAKSNQFALPAANVVGTNSVNAVMETAREANAPVILQFSNGGAVF
ncbi:MAG: class II fructose-bisphosphate aldolase, partial [Chloroflexota bacterium]